MEEGYVINSPVEVSGTAIEPAEIILTNGINVNIIRMPIASDNIVFPLPGTTGQVGDTLTVTSPTGTDWVTPAKYPLLQFIAPDYDTFIAITLGSYFTIGNGLYQGSDFTSSITSISAIVDTTIDASGQVRIYDETHDLVIAESATFDNHQKEIITMTSISNIPTTPSVIEFQVRRAGGVLGVARLYNVTLYS